MRKFEDFIAKGDVKIQEKNKILAEALVKSSGKTEKYIKKLRIDDESAEYVICLAYDAIRELIEAKIITEGFKSYSHEADILFLKKFKEFNESEIIFLDNLRKIRNGIKYYGKEANREDAVKTLEFMNSILPKLKGLLKNEK